MYFFGRALSDGISGDNLVTLTFNRSAWHFSIPQRLIQGHFEVKKDSSDWSLKLFLYINCVINPGIQDVTHKFQTYDRESMQVNFNFISSSQEPWGQYFEKSSLNMVWPVLYGYV